MHDYTITFWAKRKGAWFGHYYTATVLNRPNLARAWADLLTHLENKNNLRGGRIASYTESPASKS